MLKKERMTRAREGWKFGMSATHSDVFPIALKAKGRFIFDMTDARTGERLHYFERDNIITLDAGIQAARLFKDPTEPAHGINMLAVGTGATGSLLSPDAPDPRQRKLNAELARKAFSATTFRDSSGNAVAYPTNVVDFSTTYGEAEAVGPLNEMGLLSTISDNPLVKNHNPETFPTRTLTVDLSNYDVLINYLSFAVVSKPSTAILTIVWRLTF